MARTESFWGQVRAALGRNTPAFGGVDREQVLREATARIRDGAQGSPDVYEMVVLDDFGKELFSAGVKYAASLIDPDKKS